MDWLCPFIRSPSFFVIVLVLNFSLSNIHVATSAFFWLVFTWYIYFSLFIFNLSVAIYLKGCCFFLKYIVVLFSFHFYNLCLLNGESTFNVTIRIAEFKSISCILFSILLLLSLLSHFSRVQLCATPWTAAYQASPSMGFSRQEHWSGLPFPSPVHESEK